MPCKIHRYIAKLYKIKTKPKIGKRINSETRSENRINDYIRIKNLVTLKDNEFLQQQHLKKSNTQAMSFANSTIEGQIQVLTLKKQHDHIKQCLQQDNITKSSPLS